MTTDWHETTVRVRYAETDAMGFLHHANYAVFFEMGRTELFRSMGGNYRLVEEQGLFFVVVSLECRFSKPAVYDDVLTIRTRIARVSPAKLEHDYEVVRDGQVLTTGHTVLACVDRNRRVRPIPELPGVGA